MRTLGVLAAAHTGVPPNATIGKPFSDTFTGTTIDLAKWTVYDRLGDQINAEINAVIPANVRVSSGTLKLDGKFEDVVAGDTTTGPPNPRTVHYTTAHVAQATQPFLYGTVDVRAKIAGAAGLSPCIWMLGHLWQPSQPYTADTFEHNWPHGGWWECDLGEFPGNQGNTRFGCNPALHFITANRVGGSNVTLPFDAATRFMVYRLTWTATSMLWQVDAEDGVGFRTMRSFSGAAGTDIPNTPGYLIIHMAVGGPTGGTPNPAQFPQTTEVDYVQIT